MRVYLCLPVMPILVALCVIASPAHATNAYKSAFEQAYPAAVGSRIDACALCHTSPPTLNPFGTAFRGAGFNFTAIEPLDSDGDGFTNIQEITALTFPGNAADSPGHLQSGGCAGLSCQKSDLSLDGVKKMLGDLLVVGLSLITLQIMSRRRM